MWWLSLLLVLSFALPAFAESPIRACFIGDPQIGWKDQLENVVFEEIKNHPDSSGLYAWQVANFENAVRWCGARGTSKIFGLGDYSDASQNESETGAFRDALEGLDGGSEVVLVMGNHDVNWDYGAFSRAGLDMLMQDPDVRRPFWGTTTAGNVHFVWVTTGFYDYNAYDGLASALDGSCRDAANADGGACSVTSPDDPYLYGGAGVPGDTCAADEVCFDIAGSGTAQMAYVAAQFALYKANGDTNAFVLIGHQAPWPASNGDLDVGDCSEVSNSTNAYHEVGTCSVSGDYCYESGTGGNNAICPVGGTQTCDASEGTCNSAAGKDWRTQLDTIFAGETVQGFSGHTHGDQTHTGTTGRGTVYTWYVSQGTTGKNNGAVGDPGRFLYAEWDAAGNVDVTSFPANPGTVSQR